MSSFNYEYFCGANVTIAVNEQPLLECAGISYSVMDSQTPIYGYSSRLFDAVAPGQKLVQGSFVVNFVRPSYVYDHIAQGLENRQAAIRAENQALRQLDLVKEQEGVEMTPEDYEAFREGIKAGDPAAYAKWLSEEEDIGEAAYDAASTSLRELSEYDLPSEILASDRGNTDPTMVGPFDIYVYFGDPTLGRKHIFYGCYITGHGSTIQIDENVILEEYNFFARDVVPWNLSRSLG